MLMSSSSINNSHWTSQLLALDLLTKLVKALWSVTILALYPNK
jgi:hypothetical protein